MCKKRMKAEKNDFPFATFSCYKHTETITHHVLYLRRSVRESRVLQKLENHFCSTKSGIHNTNSGLVSNLGCYYSVKLRRILCYLDNSKIIGGNWPGFVCIVHKK